MRALYCLVVAGAAGCNLYFDSPRSITAIPDASIGVDSTGPVFEITCGQVGAGTLRAHPSWQIEAGSDGGALATVQTDASFAFAFRGTSLTIGVEDGPGIGTYGVSIDGGLPVLIDGQTAVAASNTPTVIELAPDAASGGHVAQVTCEVAPCQVDSFVSACPPS